jgi:outer membrane lipoprotein-sorting protein
MFLAMLLALLNFGDQGLKSGEELIAAMRARYNASWYRTLSFVQLTTSTDKEGKKKVNTWYERMIAPGNLRIDIAPYDSGNGFMHANDSAYSIKRGKVVSSDRVINILQLLGFDIYFFPVEKTVKELRNEEVDVSLLHEESFEGRPAYVVGARAGDLHAQQFWVDKERLILLRWMQRSPRDTSKMMDIRFNKYEHVAGGGWIEREVIMLLDGKEIRLEEYTEVKTRIPMSADVFVPANWMKTLPK